MHASLTEDHGIGQTVAGFTDRTCSTWRRHSAKWGAVSALSSVLVPSTFNIFGPHHYYNGDWHVVSPGQIIGEKNFADLPDAPNYTLVPEWHFKPLRLPSAVAV